MKKIKKEITITYFEDVDAGFIELETINPGDISKTETFLIESNKSILFVNMDINNRILGFELDNNMSASIGRSIKDELDKVADK